MYVIFLSLIGLKQSENGGSTLYQEMPPPNGPLREIRQPLLLNQGRGGREQGGLCVPNRARLYVDFKCTKIIITCDEKQSMNTYSWERVVRAAEYTSWVGAAHRARCCFLMQ